MEHKFFWSVLIIFIFFVLFIASFTFFYHLDPDPNVPKSNENILTNEAELKIEDIFQTTDAKFIIWPPRHMAQSEPESRFILLAGVKNTAQNGQDHRFGIKIDYIEGTGPGSASSWLPFNHDNSRIIEFSEHSKYPLPIDIPFRAKEGSYVFRVTACTDAGAEDPNVMPDMDDYCPEDYPNIWDTKKEFVLEISN